MKPVRLMISGGLGNQMFQYAASYALAKSLNVPLNVDVWSYTFDPLRGYALDAFGIEPLKEAPKADIQQYMTLGFIPKVKSMLPDFIVRPVRYLYRKTLRKVLEEKASENRYIETDFHFNKLFFNLKDGAVITGNFQSENYFAGIKEDIRKAFTLKTPLSIEATQMAEKIRQTSVSASIHIRRGDYLSAANAGVHGAMSLEYYKKAVQLIKAMHPDVKFFVFTDDVAYVKESFDFLGDYTLVSDVVSDQHEDLFLMSLCKHNIIANSSFSWWGAWLNNNQHKTIIAPRQWFSDDILRERNMADFYPKGWLLI